MKIKKGKSIIFFSNEKKNRIFEKDYTFLQKRKASGEARLVLLWLSIDPLSEKYVYNGPYNFSENRVIDGRELEGLEVILLKDSEHNKPVINAANNGNYADNPFTKTIHVFAHGNPSEFYNDNGKNVTIT